MKIIKLLALALILCLLLMGCSSNNETEISVSHEQAETVASAPGSDITFHTLDSMYERWYTQFLLTVGDREICFEGLARAWNETPVPIIADLNGDAIPEIIIALDTRLGIGVNIQEIHIFDGVSLEKYEVRCPIEILDEQLTLSADENHYYISGGIEEFVINKSDVINSSEIFSANPDLLPDELGRYDFFCKYIIQDEHLYAYLPINISDAEFYGTIAIKYGFTENYFDFVSITVNEDNFFETVYYEQLF